MSDMVLWLVDGACDGSTEVYARLRVGIKDVFLLVYRDSEGKKTTRDVWKVVITLEIP